LLLVAGALAVTSAFAQSAPPQAGAAASAQAATSTAAQANSDAAQLASGTKFEAALNQTLDANKNKVGDTVVAHTTDDVKSNGKVVLPKNTKLVGHITEVKAKGKDDANSTLGVVFDHAEMKGGQQVPLNLGIQAIAAAQNTAAAGTDDAMTMGGGGAMAGAGGAMGGGSASGGGAAHAGGGGGGLLGGAGSAAGGAVGSTVNTAGSATGAAANTAGSAAGTTRGVAGGAANSVSAVSPHAQMSSASQGAIGLNGLALNSQASNQTQGSVITGTGRNVHLDSGTRVLFTAGASQN
ncbi:MAG TPA: hypothetical protein VFO34_08385, partial [Candidatus Acidoferrales bacterium]|nr:hypothetical protein [Candidatus Acidoferrales bacterium]